jgi:dUTP pyrophosphatase
LRKKVKKFSNSDFSLPLRKTTGSAGYDFIVAEDTIIPPYNELIGYFDLTMLKNNPTPAGECYTYIEDQEYPAQYYTLDTIAEMTKKIQTRPTLVSTGVKAYMPKDMYLELSVRSSCPFKHWLIMANGVGIIDSDYVDNPDNEGEIFFQLINLSSVPIMLRKGDVIGQGIFKKYYKTDDDMANAKRVGGFGSTDV